MKRIFKAVARNAHAYNTPYVLLFKWAVLKFFTLRVSPPAHLKTAALAKHADSRVFQACFRLPPHISPVPPSSRLL
eukprot:120060-Pyramimonas_sp.AAC.1